MTSPFNRLKLTPKKKKNIYIYIEEEEEEEKLKHMIVQHQGCDTTHNLGREEKNFVMTSILFG